MEKWFLALVGLTSVKGRIVQKKVAKKDRKGEARQLFWGTILNHKSIESRSPKSLKQRSPKNIEFDAKGVPKWIQNRCPD